jgi:hypothetical protein
MEDYDYDEQANPNEDPALKPKSKSSKDMFDNLFSLG